MISLEIKMVLRLKKTSGLVHKLKACKCIVLHKICILFWERVGGGREEQVNVYQSFYLHVDYRERGRVFISLHYQYITLYKH